jgi:hypothetical protein
MIFLSKQAKLRAKLPVTIAPEVMLRPINGIND